MGSLFAKGGDNTVKIIKDTSIALLTTAGLILTITFGLIAAVLPRSILLQIRVPIVVSCVCLITSIIAGVYLIRYLIGSAEEESESDTEQTPLCGNAKDSRGNLTKAKSCSRVQFLFFVFGIGALIVAVGVRLFDLN